MHVAIQSPTFLRTKSVHKQLTILRQTLIDTQSKAKYVGQISESIEVKTA